MTHDDLHPAFSLSKFTYWADFAVVPPVILFLLLMGHDPKVIPGVAFGVVIWTLMEYWIHRLAFHDYEPLSIMHDVHHQNPKGYIGVAPWHTLAGFGQIFLLFMLLAGGAGACSLTAGIMIGYLFYIAIHGYMHHGNRARFDRYTELMFRHHAGHHRGGHGNYGVSSPLWDLVFRTFKESK